MKYPRPGQGAGRGNHSRAAVKTSLADSDSCPHAAECRIHWRHIAQTETAECAHCYQILSRATLARILAGS